MWGGGGGGGGRMGDLGGNGVQTVGFKLVEYNTGLLVSVFVCSLLFRLLLLNIKSFDYMCNYSISKFDFTYNCSISGASKGVRKCDLSCI